MFKILVTDDEQIVIDSLSFIINKNFTSNKDKVIDFLFENLHYEHVLF